ncbi:antirestriction protein [Paraburkholderia sp. BR10936]|uniref:antirestriction protein n=1 Tax=Paraburkholderia sp. BR10936 TaxID=3236993 RepID=UPI0034D31E10
MQSNLVTARPVSDDRRMGFLPHLFGPMYNAGESGLFSYARMLAPEQYQGGHWDFYELSNGGGFAVPTGPEVWELTSENQDRQRMTREAAGIVFTLFSLGRQMERCALHTSEATLAALSDMHTRLYQFAREHDDWRAIRAVLD